MVKIGKYQKKLMTEMNQYAEETGTPTKYDEEHIKNRFTEPEAKKLVKEHTLTLMLSDYKHDKGLEPRKAKYKKPVKRCKCSK